MPQHPIGIIQRRGHLKSVLPLVGLRRCEVIGMVPAAEFVKRFFKTLQIDAKLFGEAENLKVIHGERLLPTYPGIPRECRRRQVSNPHSFEEGGGRASARPGEVSHPFQIAAFELELLLEIHSYFDITLRREGASAAAGLLGVGVHENETLAHESAIEVQDCSVQIDIALEIAEQLNAVAFKDLVAGALLRFKGQVVGQARTTPALDTDAKACRIDVLPRHHAPHFFDRSVCNLNCHLRARPSRASSSSR